MRDMEVIVPKLRALRKAGIRIAIDDFGTGYSSLVVSAAFPGEHVEDRPQLRRRHPGGSRRREHHQRDRCDGARPEARSDRGGGRDAYSAEIPALAGLSGSAGLHLQPPDSRRRIQDAAATQSVRRRWFAPTPKASLSRRLSEAGPAERRHVTLARFPRIPVVSWRASPPRLSIRIVVIRSSTDRCTSPCIPTLLTATKTRANSPPCSKGVGKDTHMLVRSTRRSRRSNTRSPRWRAASLPSASRPAWARSERCCSLCCAPEITSFRVLPVRQHEQSVCEFRKSWRRGDVRRCDVGRGGAMRRYGRTRGSCSSRRSPTLAPRSPISKRSANCVRERDLVYVVDNTMTSPYLFQPRRVGASSLSTH